MSNVNFSYTKAGIEVIGQMMKEMGQRTVVDIITDIPIDFNKDGKISSVELTILRNSINRNGEVVQQRLKGELDKLNNGNTIFSVSTNIDNKPRKATYVIFSDYKYIEVEEFSGKKLVKRLGVHPDRIEIENDETRETIVLPRNNETEEKYLDGIDLDI